MLVLTRKVQEVLLLAEGNLTEITPDTIIIRLLEIQGDRVRLGIQAPIKYNIVREELLLSTKKSE